MGHACGRAGGNEKRWCEVIALLTSNEFAHGRPSHQIENGIHISIFLRLMCALLRGWKINECFFLF